MFTGIIVATGRVKRTRARSGMLELEIGSSRIARELRRGESVAVDGVCLTATKVGRKRFEAEVTGETLARTTLGALERGRLVNLELPARPTDRLGGHLVQGHVDGVAEVTRVEDDNGTRRVWAGAPEEVLRYLVAKGSVALDGVSLTVVDVGRTTFQVALIPHTLSNSTLADVDVGARMNVEVDVVAKYVERFVERDR